VARRAPGFRPKLFLGFSDLTALHLALAAHGDLVTFHGPNVIGMPRLDAASQARLRATLLGVDREATFAWSGLGTVRGGKARGRLMAGNLSMLCALAGTPYAVPLEGTILVVEDVNEPAYRLDRMLTQLSLQPGATGLAGLALGDLGVAAEDRPLVERAVARVVGVLGCPAVEGFPAGHGSVNHPVPLGIQAELDADAGTLRALEDPYAG
jgi:muramoyltetrapeptide carboxypeptidase